MSFALVHQSNNYNNNYSTDRKTWTPKHSSPSTYRHRFNNSDRNYPGYIFHLQQGIGNQDVQKFLHSKAAGFDFAKVAIQPKLKINQPEDEYEKEADRVAEQVMKMAVPLDSAAPMRNAKYDNRIDRKCADCQTSEESKENEAMEIMTKPSHLSKIEINDNVTNKIKEIHSSGGSSLDLNTREFMELRFSGYDFRNVKIHSGEQAAKSATSANALAYTFGNNIVFGEGYYRPDTIEGRRLLAHELTHVVQQGFTSKLVQDSRKMIHSNHIPASNSKTSYGVDHSIEHMLAKESDITLQRQPYGTPAVSVRSPVIEEFVTQVSSLLPGRPLGPREEQLARSIFASSIDYSRVRLINTDVLEYRTIGNNIRVPKDFTITNAEMAKTLIHEMTHVWQYQHGETSYISTSLQTQIAAGIRGSRNLAYDYQISPGASFFDFRPEQQGLLVENYYAMLRDKNARQDGTYYLSNHLDASGNFRSLSWTDRQAEITRELPLHEPLIRQMQAAFPRPETEILLQRASEVIRMPGEGILNMPRELEPTPIKPLIELRF